MGSIDKAAIGWSIAIVAIGVGIAAMGGSLQGSLPEMTAPTIAAPTLSGGSADDKLQAAKEQIEKEKMEREQAMMEQKEMVEPAPIAAPEPEPEPVAAPEPEPEPVAAPEQAVGPQTIEVSMPVGTAVPGCEATNECYIPATVSINTGDTVTWINDDTAAHTVTSGGPTTGPDGNFDSSLVMGGAEFSHTFNSAGTYDYFCMVHPWMKGVISVS